MPIEKHESYREDEIKGKEQDFRVFMSETLIYRKIQGDKLDKLSNKIDNILEKLNMLPCRERAGIYDSICRQLGVLWVFVSGIVLSIITIFFRDGGQK